MVTPVDRNLVLVGDARECLRRLPAGSIHCVVTSPPYLGLRSYGTPPQVWGGDLACAHVWQVEQVVRECSTSGRKDLGSTLDAAGGPKAEALSAAHTVAATKPRRVDESATCTTCGAWRGHLGLEETPEAYVEHLVEVFREVRRVLRADGTVWLNIGDSFAANRSYQVPASKWRDVGNSKPCRVPPGLKPKDLMLIPFRVALALQADGWWVRSDICWAKPNPMPESVLDRPTRAHEYIFLLAKSKAYFYDAFAVREPDAGRASGNVKRKVADGTERGRLNTHLGSSVPYEPGGGRNPRDVWTIAQPMARVRDDLPLERRAYVLAELARRGVL